jgi:hypothetical protein
MQYEFTILRVKDDEIDVYDGDHMVMFREVGFAGWPDYDTGAVDIVSQKHALLDTLCENTYMLYGLNYDAARELLLDLGFVEVLA